MNQSRNYEVIVVGLGAMGSATIFHLARRGVRTLGIEQFEAGHTRGSSHGDSRIIRETYFEHPLYVPLVRRAHELWRELETISGSALMTIKGGLMIGPPDGSVVSGTLRSAREHGLPYEILTREQVRQRFPAFEISADSVAVLDPRAGYLDPEACQGSPFQQLCSRFQRAVCLVSRKGSALPAHISRRFLYLNLSVFFFRKYQFWCGSIHRSCLPFSRGRRWIEYLPAHSRLLL